LLLVCGFVSAQQADTLTDYFIPAEFMQAMGLKGGSGTNPQIRGWNGPIESEVNQVVDIRWTFATNKEALSYFKKNLEDQAEGGVPYPFPQSYGLDVKELHVYREAPLIGNMFAGMGSKHVQWYFIFLVDKVMVKVFVNGWNTPYAKAREIASKAAEVTAGKQKVIYNAYPLPVVAMPAAMIALLEHAKAEYEAPAGYVSTEVKENLDVKYHYAVIHPSKESEIRYFILPFDSVPGDPEKKMKFNEMMVSTIFLTDLLNTRGVADKKLPDMYEIKEENGADKGWVSYIEPKSGFASGYRYCMATAIYKEGVGFIEIFHLATDRNWFTAEPQITPFTIRFSK
jgi:hypothetical protein